jgi:hypothetical protein
MLSDNDLCLITYKTKYDPFFKKLRFIRNKLPANNSIPIYSYFDHKNQDIVTIKLATAGLMGFHSEEDIAKQLLK